MKTLRLILGDQLNRKHSWFNDVNPNITYVLFELKQEAQYVKHHILKICGFFLSMRSLADDLRAKGHQVIYYTINDQHNTQSLTLNLEQLIASESFECFEYQEPDEYRLQQQLNEFCKTLSIAHKTYDSEHFYTNKNEVKTFFKDKKQWVMESFYRYMRIKHQLLMLGNNPLGGQWNFDKENRNKWSESNAIPKEINFNHRVEAIIQEIEQAGIGYIGQIKNAVFDFPINEQEALLQLHFFCEKLLPFFGTFQDAMHIQQVNLFHSRISFALNSKIISPKQVVAAVLEAYHNQPDVIEIAQVEGFIRQIVGWREYMRGMYWALMPEFKTLNFFNHQQPLPDFFWNGKTKMNCLKHCLNNSLENAYAHHIQRLMVIGNYALLTQCNPDEVDTWYLGVYADAIEWVQLPNTRGMSQFADGGKIATKPYISSGAYIQKMSNYCKDCVYDVKQKTTKNACPFNSLYWNFLMNHRNKLENNARMGMMFKVLDKMNKSEKEAIQIKANQHLIHHE